MLALQLLLFQDVLVDLLSQSELILDLELLLFDLGYFLPNIHMHLLESLEGVFFLQLCQVAFDLGDFIALGDLSITLESSCDFL